jgi:hypothetical protein
MRAVLNSRVRRLSPLRERACHGGTKSRGNPASCSCGRCHVSLVGPGRVYIATSPTSLLPQPDSLGPVATGRSHTAAGREQSRDAEHTSSEFRSFLGVMATSPRCRALVWLASALCAACVTAYPSLNWTQFVPAPAGTQAVMQQCSSHPATPILACVGRRCGTHARAPPPPRSHRQLCVQARREGPCSTSQTWAILTDSSSVSTSWPQQR